MFGPTLNIPRSISIKGLENLSPELRGKLQKFIDAARINPRQLDVWVEAKRTKTMGTVTLGRDLKSPFVWFDNIICHIKDLLDNFDKAMEDLESAFLLPREREALKSNKLTKRYHIFRKVSD